MIYELVLWYHVITSRAQILGASVTPLAAHEFSLENRWDNSEFVNDVFKDNILLALHYLDGRVDEKGDINWDEINQPFHTDFTLEPGQVFAFHEDTVKEYSDQVVKTTNAHFIGSEGFKSDGYLIGDGVCHLASLINWVAQDAGLEVFNPSDHNFAKINDVPKEYGSGILSPNPLGNLYVVNSLDEPVTFVFDFDGEKLSVGALK
jgi:hypothetical protein